MDRCRKMHLLVKIQCCELCSGFHRPNFVVYSIPIFFIKSAHDEKLFSEL